MYAQAIVDERLEMARDSLGWAPEYHTVAEVEQFNRDLESKYEDIYQAAASESQGTQDAHQTYHVNLLRNLTPRLTPAEVRWMENERHLCMCDAAYFLTRYYFIKDNENVIRRFSFRSGQRVFFGVISELEAREAAIEIISGKARQLGISTLTEGLELHRVCFTYSVNAIIASADRTKTSLMAQMLLLGYDMLPWWLKPLYTRRVESDQGMLVFGGMKSGVSFQHGAQTSGIARGSTITVYHLSEAASYTNAGAQIEDSLFKCVHSSRNVFGNVESSFEGDEGWFYDTYWYAKREWTNGRSRLCAMFLPWFLGTELYPTATWIRTRPVPNLWVPQPETREMISRARLYVASNPMLEKVLGARWSMGAEQAWFWESNYIEHRAKGREKMWFQEMPTDDVEAGQGSFDNVFGRDTIAEVDTRRQRDYKVYGIVGQSIEDKHEPDPDEVDYNGKRLPVIFRNPRGDGYRWELVPLRFDDRMLPSIEKMDKTDMQLAMGKLFVYLPPEPGWDYSIGIDTSSGIGRDATCIAVCRRARHGEGPDVQAAEFRSNTVSHVEAFAFGMVIGAYYARHMGEDGGPRMPYVAIEQLATVGDTCQLQMAKMGWSCFHQMVRYDSKKIRKQKAVKRGWYTNSWSRPMLTDGFVIAVQNGWYVANSIFTLCEMKHWEMHLTASGKEKKEHGSGWTDDGVFANAMATFCPNDLSMLTKRTRKRCVESGEDGSLPAIEIGDYTNSMSPHGWGTQNEPRRDWDMEELLG